MPHPYWDRPPQPPGKAFPRAVEADMEHGTGFTAILYKLFSKADNINIMILAKAFPRQFQEWFNWRAK